MCYENGTGVDKDPAEAARLFALAAEQGLAEAQLSLGAECQDSFHCYIYSL
jgi:TPR repeat protein